MSASRFTAFAALLLGVCAGACGGDGPAPVAPPERATPPPTAYIGTLAATPGAEVVRSVGEDAYELARTASLVMVDGAAPFPVASDVASTGASRRAATVSSGRARVVDRAATGEKRVALTFDAGADRGYAEQILDTLRAAGVKASFGMTGQWAEANPDLVKRMAAEGHQLINHTYSHDSFTGVSTGRGPKSSEDRARELALTEQAVLRIAGVSTKPYFRPPYGDLDSSVSEDVRAQGYDVIAMWTVDSQGWRGLSRSAVEARCLRMAAPGAVYVFHVGSAAQDGPALAGIIEGLQTQGYGMGTLDWLLSQ